MNFVPAAILAGLLAFQPVCAVAEENIQCLEGSKLIQAKNSEENAGSKDQLFGQLVNEAECLREAAALAGSEWLKTGELISLARQEAASGNWKAATGLAEKARFQALAALQQAEYETTAWKKRVVE